MEKYHMELSTQETGFLGTNPIDIILLYPETPDIHRLHRSFREALIGHTLLSSVLTKSPNGYSFQFQADAAPFIVGETIPRDSIYDLGMHQVLESVKTAENENVLNICVTPLAPRGMLLGISMSHAIGDGYSIFHFLKTWSAIYRRYTFEFPSQRRMFRISKQQVNELLQQTSEFRKINGRPRSGWKNRTEQVFTYNDDVTQSIVNLCSSKSKDHKISFHAAMTVFLLSSLHHLLVPGPVFRLKTAVNLRNLLPDLEPNYFGNAWIDASATFQRDEFDTVPLHQLAQRIDASIESARQPESIRSLCEVSEFGIRNLPGWSQQQSFNPQTDIVSSNLRKFGSASGPNFDLGEGQYFANQISAPRGILMRAARHDNTLIRIWSEDHEGNEPSVPIDSTSAIESAPAISTPAL